MTCKRGAWIHMDKDVKWIESQIGHYIKAKNYDMARKQAIHHRNIKDFNINLALIKINDIEAKNKIKPKVKAETKDKTKKEMK
jgi:hypothetical protein